MVVADPTLPKGVEITIDESSHTIRVRTDESYIPGVLLKTLNALKTLLGDPQRTFTHILRTNLSSVWHWARLLAVIDTLSTYGNYVAGTLNYNKPSYVRAFVSGAGALTREVGQLIVDRAQELRYDLYDDLAALGILIDKLNVRRIPLQRCDFINNTLPSVLDLDPTCIHYQVKNNDVDRDNSRDFYDAYILSRLYFELYGDFSRTLKATKKT